MCSYYYGWTISFAVHPEGVTGHDGVQQWGKPKPDNAILHLRPLKYLGGPLASPSARYLEAYVHEEWMKDEASQFTPAGEAHEL